MTNSSNENQKPVNAPANPQQSQSDKQQQNQGDNKPATAPQQK